MGRYIFQLRDSRFTHGCLDQRLLAGAMRRCQPAAAPILVHCTAGKERQGGALTAAESSRLQDYGSIALSSAIPISLCPKCFAPSIWGEGMHLGHCCSSGTWHQDGIHTRRGGHGTVTLQTHRRRRSRCVDFGQTGFFLFAAVQVTCVMPRAAK